MVPRTTPFRPYRTMSGKPPGYRGKLTRYLAELPEVIGDDVAAWVDALAGRGRRPSPPVRWVTIRTYLTFAEPALRDWARTRGGLRAVDRQDVLDAIQGHSGRSAHNVHTALRSLFRGLKREGRVFTDPARRVTGHFGRALPRGVPLDRLRGLLDRVADPRGRLVIALVAVHALAVEELRRLRRADYDAVRCALVVHRPAGPHTVVLDPLVAGLMTTWLRARAELWPGTANPHLLITHLTALNRAPMSRYGLEGPFRTAGVGAGRLRADRILDEASYTADPVQLVNVFGIAINTAVRYVRAAHPERFVGQPTVA